MRDDEPTIPNLGGYDPDDPRWSFVGRRTAPPVAGQSHPILLGASLGANVALVIAMLCLLLLAHAGYFSPNDGTPSGSATHATPSATASPTATALATPTSTAIELSTG